MKKRLTGFTLIELMVVITIIGILAVIVLPNLTSVRGRGQDTAVKQQLSFLRSQAAIYYDDQYGYTSGAVSTPLNTDCLTSAGAVNSSLVNSVYAETDVVKALNGIRTNGNGMPKCFLGSSAIKSQSWAVIAPLRTGGNWCVDSAGSSNKVASSTTAISGTEAVCPAS